MTPQLMTFAHISMINSLYIGSTLFSQTTHANHAKLVTLITVNLTAENAVASLTVESIGRTWYRPAVLTVRTIETTGCICAIHHLDTTIVLIFDVLCHLRHVVFCGECNYSIIAHVEISRKNYDANHRSVSVILHIMLSSCYRMCSICNSCIIHTDHGDSFAQLQDKSKLLLRSGTSLLFHAVPFSKLGQTRLFQFRRIDIYTVAEALCIWNFSYNLLDKVMNSLINV